MSEDWDASQGIAVVIGSGLIGASIGLALTGAGHRVHVEDRVGSHALVAAGLGAGSVDPAPADEVALVVVAVPPDAIPATVDAALGRFPHAVVTDVGSVKGAILDRLARAGTPMQRYVGSHPMAGSERSGPLAADKDLFAGRTWVIAPSADAEPWAVARVRRLAEACQATVVIMPGGEHDQAVARVSHVPQVMSSLTAGHLRGVPASQLRLAGQGIRDVTRIAASDPVLWRQIIAGNAEAVRAELTEIRADLDAVLDVLDDPAGLEEFFSRGRAGAMALPGKHGADQRDWTTVVVEIPDAPGALAQLFAVIDASGVNVEDLAIEHDAVRNVGFLSIQVADDAADGLRRAVSDHGWHLMATIGAVTEQVIAIDGPSGAGKSSTSKGVARRLGLAYLDTGSMYRAVTVAQVDAGIADDDRDAIIELVRGLDIRVGTDPYRPSISVATRDVTELIRDPAVSKRVSAAAAIPEVRERLTAQMRDIIEASGRRIVVEGRDATTVIWPQAQVRVLLVADPDVRVARRQAELSGDVDTDAVTDQVVRRDRDDARVSDFMTAADGVVTIDSTLLGLDEVVDAVCRLAAPID